MIPRRRDRPPGLCVDITPAPRLVVPRGEDPRRDLPTRDETEEHAARRLYEKEGCMVAVVGQRTGLTGIEVRGLMIDAAGHGRPWRACTQEQAREMYPIGDTAANKQRRHAARRVRRQDPPPRRRIPPVLCRCGKRTAMDPCWKCGAIMSQVLPQ